MHREGTPASDNSFPAYYEARGNILTGAQLRDKVAVEECLPERQDRYKYLYRLYNENYNHSVHQAAISGTSITSFAAIQSSLNLELPSTAIF